MTEVGKASSPAHGRIFSKSKGSLVVDVDTIWNIGNRDHIDVVRWLLGRWLHSRSFDKTREPFSVSLDRLINPVSNWYFWSRIWETSVDITLLQWRRGIGKMWCHQGAEKRRCGAQLHGEHDGNECKKQTTWKDCREVTSVRKLDALAVMYLCEVCY